MKRAPILTVLPMFALLTGLAAAPAGAASDPGWPRQIVVPEAKILVYQPQPDGHDGNIVTARAAVSVTGKGKTVPTFGTVWFRVRGEIDREKRMVEFADLTVPKSRFPGATPEDEQKLAALLEKEMPKWNLTMSLDRLVASLKAVEKEKEYAENFNNTPPNIIVEKVPALLVLVDGQPVLRPVKGSESLQRVVNTPVFLVFDGKDYYLSGGAAWFKNSDLKGEWKATKSPPKEVAAYYESTVQPAGGKTKGAAPKPADAGAKTPKIVVANEPTELLVLEGEPKYSPVTDTDLVYISNTKSDIFMDLLSQRLYLLLSGRWFTSKSLQGPWEFVKSAELPADFKKIPEPSRKGNVLSSVAGTPQAEEAVLDAQVPQTAAVKRAEAKTKVEYDGEPQFKPVTGTEVEYAVNTSSQVLRIKGKYYVCDQAIWFVGDSPNGPWTVSDKAPPEVQQIPPDSPAYNTKYVYVYDSTPDVVYVGYMPGYVGCYPYYGTVVWGTGWYYPPYISPYAYYPRPVTWGLSVGYNPYTGWSFGIGFSAGPFHMTFWGGGGYGGYYGPVYGHGGGNTINIGEINVGGGGNRPGGGGNWNQGAGNRPSPKGTNDNIYNRGENKGRNASTMDKSRPQAKTAQGAANNVYSDRDGNVYQRSKDGSWQQREGNSWKSAGGGADASQRPAGAAGAGTKPSTGATGGSSRPSGGGYGGGAPAGLNSDYSARQRGTARTQSFSSGGGMRGGGGGMRGGGGSRR